MMSVLGYLAMAIICHSIFSALRWRTFLQGNTQPITSLPADILAELIMAGFLSCIVIVSHARKLRKINVFQRTLTWDKALERKNFKDFNSERCVILQNIVKERMGLTHFQGP